MQHAVSRALVSIAVLIPAITFPLRSARADGERGYPISGLYGVAVPVGPRAVDPPVGVVAPDILFSPSWMSWSATAKRKPISEIRPVLGFHALFGKQHARSPDDDVAYVTFRMRPGVQLIEPLGRTFEVVAGVGSTLTFWPIFSPSISPELGGRVCAIESSLGCAYFQLIARADVNATSHNPVAGSLLLGITGY
jgi:hypothetical protein